VSLSDLVEHYSRAVIALEASALGPGGRHTGIGEYTYRLLEGLRDRDVRVDVLLAPGDADLPRLGPKQKAVRMAWPRLGRYAPALATQVGLPGQALRRGWKLLHLPGVQVRPSRVGIPQWTPCPRVVTVHDVLPLTFYDGSTKERTLPSRLRRFYAVQLRAARGAAAVITVSQGSRSALVNRGRFNPEKVHVVYNGVSLPVFRDVREELGLPESYLLYVGSFEPRKNLTGMLRAYALARSRQLRTPLVCMVEEQSGHAASAIAIADSLGIGAEVRWRYALRDEDLFGMYARAKAVIFPSLAEGFGLPALQALALGRPLMVGLRSGVEEVVGDAAMLVDVSDPAALADGLLKIDSDTALRRRLSRRGPVVAAPYTWSACVAATCDVYRQVAQLGDEWAPSCA
jgi:glycosyltransferase involved in cell wall biosynthesis